MRREAALLATLFLNFAFWYSHGNTLWLPYSLPVNAVLTAIFSALISLLFLAGPALAVYCSGADLFTAIENSLGTLPTHGIRLFAIWAIVSLLNEILRLVSWSLTLILRRDATAKEFLITAVLLFIFLAYTALQSLETNATLAKFTNRLGVAFLLAAVVRLRDAWPQTLPDLLHSSATGATAEDFRRLSRLAHNLAPLGLLGAAYAERLIPGNNVIRTAFLGFALPLGATLLTVNTINIATLHSGFYQPSLEPNIRMALWGGAAGSYLAGFDFLSTITTFGAARFLIRAIPLTVPSPRFHLPAVITTLALTLGVFLWRKWMQELPFPAEFEIEFVILTIVAGILSADALYKRPNTPKPIDWPATTALVAAFAVAYQISHSPNPALESWWCPWTFPAYFTAFTLTLLARKLPLRLAIPPRPR